MTSEDKISQIKILEKNKQKFNDVMPVFNHINYLV